MTVSGGSAINFNRSAPVIDYTSLDFTAFRADIQVYAAATYADRWTDFNPDQFGVVFLELLAYSVDLLTFTVNAGLRELATPTVQRRSHMLTLAQMLDYQLGSASPASTALVVTSNPATLPYVMAAATTQFAAGSVVFQPDVDYTITSTPQTINVVEGQQFVATPLGTSAGTASQTFVVPNAPIIDGTLFVFISSVAWSTVLTLTNSSPGDTVYLAVADDEGNVTVTFGDGVNGKIPPTTSAITASYIVGGGVRGRVGAGAITSLLSVPAGVQSVTNPSAATGGNDQQTLQQARSAQPASLSAGDRCVTLPDYAVKALAASTSVAKSSTIQQDTRTIRVVVAPTGGGVASDALKNTVAAYLSARKQVGHRIVMADPFYIPLVINVDLFVTQSAKVGDISVAAQALFLTASSTDQQNGLLDFDNVGFAARTDSGDPQLTFSLVDRALDKLSPRGLQTSRVNQLTTIPQLKPFGFTNSVNAALAWVPTTSEVDQLTRRRWRVQFTSSTTYNVFEGINGSSTQLTGGVLTDDRALFPVLTAIMATVNPNTNQPTSLQVNELLSTGQNIVLALPTDNLYAYAVPGDPYRVEWPATPSSGTVGTPFTPTKFGGDVHGFSWTINGTGFTSGDQYVIDVFGEVDDILLDVDEIPTLSASNLVINIRTAY